MSKRTLTLTTSLFFATALALGTATALAGGKSCGGKGKEKPVDDNTASVLVEQQLYS